MAQMIILSYLTPICRAQLIIFGELMIQFKQMQCKTDHLQPSHPSQSYSQLELKGKRLTLTTSCSVELRPQCPQIIPEIISSPCQVSQNQFRTCYRIALKDVVIIVEDRITFGSVFRAPQNMEHISASELTNAGLKESPTCHKKIVLFKNRPHRDGRLNSKTAKKNIVKNVMNAFLKYLKDQQCNTQAVQSVEETVQKLIQSLKYNNPLIIAIISNERAREYFKHFLQTSAVQWIDHSKIKTKDIYHRAIQIYHQLCTDKEPYMRAQTKSVCSVQNGSSGDRMLWLRELQNYDLEDEIRGFR